MWSEKFHMKQKIDLGEKAINKKNYFGRPQVQILSLAYTWVALLTDWAFWSHISCIIQGYHCSLYWTITHVWTCQSIESSSTIANNSSWCCLSLFSLSVKSILFWSSNSCLSLPSFFCLLHLEEIIST